MSASSTTGSTGSTAAAAAAAVVGQKRLDSKDSKSTTTATAAGLGHVAATVQKRINEGLVMQGQFDLVGAIVEYTAAAAVLVSGPQLMSGASLPTFKWRG